MAQGRSWGDFEDVGAALNCEGIAVRAGHHRAQPILRRFGKKRTVRASLALYNTCEESDALVAALWNLKGGLTAGPFQSRFAFARCARSAGCALL
jgi:selenocysteine lyase/cysteine desulfurase